MFGRKKNKDADWMSGVQPVDSGLPAPDATPAAPAAPATPAIPGAPGAQTVTSIGGVRIVAPPGVQIMQPNPEQMKQAMDMAERFMGRDLDGDGQVAGASPAATGEAGVVDQLERLAKLRASGVLTDAEFAAEKAKLLK